MPSSRIAQVGPLTLLAFGLALAPARAEAGWPNDVSLSSLGDWGGSPVTDLGGSKAAYEQVVREMGAVIANKPMAPAETSGIHGFDLQLSTTMGFLDAKTQDGQPPAPWARTHVDGDPSGAMWIPGVSARKGLPLGLEAGAHMGYIAGSSQTVFGAWGRWGLVEGYRQFPDFSFQMGYSGLVGNDELDLGVMDTSFNLGYTIPFGRLQGFNEGSISPYLGAGWLKINAQPRLSDEEQQSLGVSPVSGFRSKDGFKEGFSPATIHLGARLRSGDVTMQGATVLTTTRDRVTTTLSIGMGLVY